MATTTGITYGAEFGYEERIDGIIAWVNGADDLADDEKDSLVNALFDALRDEVDERLPEDVSWQPHTAEFIAPIGSEVPDADEMTEIFADAWAAVEARAPEIERRLFGELPATGDDLERALLAIEDPMRRARVAGLLADAATARMCAAVRAAAVHEATRSRYTAARVAELLGTGEAAVWKLIKRHNHATGN